MKMQNDRNDDPSPDRQPTRPTFPNRGIAVVAVVAFAGLAWWAGVGGDSPPALDPVGTSGEVYTVDMAEPTPPAGTALSENFVPASTSVKQQVEQRLSEFRARWSAVSPTVSVTPVDLGNSSLYFAEQLDRWLDKTSLGAAYPAARNPATVASSTHEKTGLIIKCLERDSAIAAELAAALAPVVAGEVLVVFTEGAEPNHLDLFLQSRPRFNDAGVAFFPAVEEAEAAG